MINLKEFRIDNLFFTQNGDLLKVIDITRNGIGFEVVDRSKYPLSYEWQAEPIPITEEWLERLGFDDDFVKGRFEHNDYWAFCIKKSPLKDRWTLMHKCENSLVKYIFYVHQLQNVFYFLTNKELELNENTRKT